MSDESGAEHFARVVGKLVTPPSPGEMPKPSDTWGAWVEYRLKRLEDGQQWMLRVILAALLGQFALEVFKML